jgi:hypothetical protein
MDMNEAHDQARFAAENEIGWHLAGGEVSSLASMAYERGWDDAAKASPTLPPKFADEARLVAYTLRDRADDIATDNVATAYLPDDWEALNSDLLRAVAALQYAAEKANPSVRVTKYPSSTIRSPYDDPYKVVLARSELRHWANDNQAGKPVWRDIDRVLIGKWDEP